MSASVSALESALLDNLEVRGVTRGLRAAVLACVLDVLRAEDDGAAPHARGVVAPPAEPDALLARALVADFLRATGCAAALAVFEVESGAALAPSAAAAQSRLGAGRVAKRAGRLDDAAAALARALELDAGLREVAPLLERVKRLKAGKPEFEPVVVASPKKKDKEEDELQFVDSGVALAFSAGMSTAERNAAFFEQRKQIKKAEEEAAAAAEEAKLAKMTDEERAQYEGERKKQASYDAKKDKAVTRSLAQYGGRGAAILGARGRGRGRGH